MAKYVGITLGPIYDTMKLSSKPAALWGASYLFSFLGKMLCLSFQETYGAKCEIIVPYADFSTKNGEENYLAKMQEGIGLIHDRIIVLMHQQGTEEEIIAQVTEKVIEPVRAELVRNIVDALEIKELKEDVIEELKDYFQIYAVCMELGGETEIVPAISGVLDVLELEKQFIPESKQDYILRFLSNDILHRCFHTNDFAFKPKQLLNSNDKFKSIKEISGTKQYFALVQADGDGMGKVLCSLKKPEQVFNFSKKCIRYSAKASEVIGKYGGVTIYAGGDDLLFLMPIESDKINILSLIRKLREVFAEEFKEPEYAGCNVSYGVQIVYNKFPLYEAFDMAAGLLFGKAKDKRNSCAVALQKHSGQSVEFILHNFSDKDGKSTNPITEQLISLIEAKCGTDFLKSVSQHILNQKEMIKVAIENNCLSSLLDNMFDNDMQKQYKSDIEKIKEVFESTLQGEITVQGEQGLEILALLRFADFYSGGGIE